MGHPPVDLCIKQTPSIHGGRMCFLLNRVYLGSTNTRLGETALPLTSFSPGPT
jgi:hypothetical protein